MIISVDLAYCRGSGVWLMSIRWTSTCSGRVYAETVLYIEAGQYRFFCCSEKEHTQKKIAIPVKKVYTVTELISAKQRMQHHFAY